MDLFYLYNNSPKKLRDLRELAEILELQVKKPKKAHGTRWVQHRLDASQALIKSYEVICGHLEALAAANTNDTKAKGILSNLKQFSFVAHLLYLETVLVPVARLSLAWQKDSVDISHVLTAHRYYEQSLSAIKEKAGIMPASDLETLINTARENKSPVVYKNITLTNVPQGLASILANSKVYITKIEHNFNKRIKLGEDSSKLFNCARILDTRLWPSEKEALSLYGNEAVKTAAAHYLDLLDFNVDTLLEEWKAIKIFVSDNINNLPPQEIWKRVHLFYSEMYPNISKLVEIFRVFPYSNAAVERCFSTMNKVKTDWRVNLGEESLDSLIRVKKMGPTAEKFDPTAKVNIFFSTKRRPFTKPYGPRRPAEPETKKPKYDSVANAEVP